MMLTKEQADEIKRLASEAAYEYLNNMIYSRTPDETNAERMNDYIDSLVGDDEPVAWRVECRWADRSKGGGWRKYADYGTAKAAETDKIAFANPGDIESRIVPLYAAPQPPVHQRPPHQARCSMNDDPISRIEAALEAGPTPGEWDADFASGMRNGSPAVVEYFVRLDGEDISIAADIVDPETGLPSAVNADYIAACNPVAIRTLLDRLDAAEAENERLREDAERLDWIASIARINSRHGTGYVMAIEVPISGPHHFLAYSNDDVRAAIDAAMAKDQK